MPTQPRKPFQFSLLAMFGLVTAAAMLIRAPWPISLGLCVPMAIIGTLELVDHARIANRR